MNYFVHEVKPIETAYDGCLFRSRLEARWAIFFNQMQIKYEYELEGYELGKAGRYLPDFFLPGFQRYGAWVEIKSEAADFEIEKIMLVADATKCSFLMLDGTPAPKEYDVYFPDIPEIVPCIWDEKYLPGGSHGDEYRLYTQPGNEHEARIGAPIEAMKAAKQARFERMSKSIEAC